MTIKVSFRLYSYFVGCWQNSSAKIVKPAGSFKKKIGKDIKVFLGMSYVSERNKTKIVPDTIIGAEVTQFFHAYNEYRKRRVFLFLFEHNIK